MNLKQVREKLDERRGNLLQELLGDNVFQRDVIFNMVIEIRSINKTLDMLDEE